MSQSAGSEPPNDTTDRLVRARQAFAQGDSYKALEDINAVLGSDPNHLEARLLAIHAAMLAHQGDVQEALGTLLAELEAGMPETAALVLDALRLGIIMAMENKRSLEAIQGLQRALDLEPENGELHQALGAVLNREGRFKEACVHLAKARSARAGLSSFWTSFAIALQGAGAREEAEAAFRRAAELEPEDVSILLNLAQFLADAGRIPDTAPILDRVLRLKPGFPAAVSGLLATGLYDPTRTPMELANLHRAWAETLEAQIELLPRPPKNWDPQRRLTIAYLSADFREHSCAHFVEPLLEAHDRTKFRILLIPTVPQRDARTERFQSLADGWIESWTMDDETLIARLNDEGLDILLDLGGHTGFNRVTLLAKRPAPVQLEWLGYPFTTGFTRLEGRITDSAVDPPGSESLASEPLLRLDPCYLCWKPPGTGPEPVEAPSLRGEPFTFGSFNHFSKVNGAVIETWAAILRRIPGSRILLKGKGSQDSVLRERIHSGFEEEGVPRNRVLLEGWLEQSGNHLELYRKVDLALDPFPYNGVTTSIEALWMGVPFVAIRGVHSLSRHGLMLLSLLGLEGLVADGPGEYIETATAVARDPDRLSRLRGGLRAKLLASPLCDVEGFARRLESLYRRLWQEACRSHRAESEIEVN